MVARKTIALYGARRDGQVRVLEDRASDRYVVQWYEHGLRRRVVFALSREGRDSLDGAGREG